MARAEKLLTYGPTETEWKVLAFTQGDLSALRKSDPWTSARLNEDVLSKLRQEPMAPKRGSSGKAALALDEAKLLFDKVLANSQVAASLDGRYKGSPQEGFCWGRAIAVHLKALQAGLPNGSIRKLWAFGNFHHKGQVWRYHVATAVRLEDGSWVVIDPLFPGLMSAETWYRQMAKIDRTGGRTRLYATEASRFGPESDERYSRRNLADLWNHGFLVDLLETVHRENTGRPGPWAQARRPTYEGLTDIATSELEKRVLKALAGLGILASPWVVEKIVEEMRNRREPAPQSTPDGHPTPDPVAP